MPLRVLGLDPGLRLTGYGIVELPDDANPLTTDPALIEAGVFRLNDKQPIETRLAQLDTDLHEVIEEHRPGRLAVEQLFAHYNHPRTAILMGHARGVLLLAGAKHQLPIDHLPATEVKKAITGFGHASKTQMQQAVMAQCRLPEPPSPPDVADAIAIALCAARRFALEQHAAR